MNLKEILQKDFGLDLPISGGNGNSIDNPIIIHPIGMNDYVGIEYAILQCLGIGRGIEWNVVQQSLQGHGSRRIEQIKIETRQTTEQEVITQIENYYFDITECLLPPSNEDDSFNEEATLNKIRDRILELATLNEFNEQCVDLIKKGKLFRDGNPGIEFLKVLWEDESMPLFELMSDVKKKPMMQVLDIIGNQLREHK